MCLSLMSQTDGWMFSFRIFCPKSRSHGLILQQKVAQVLKERRSATPSHYHHRVWLFLKQLPLSTSVQTSVVSLWNRSGFCRGTIPWRKSFLGLLLLLLNHDLRPVTSAELHMLFWVVLWVMDAPVESFFNRQDGSQLFYVYAIGE